jgi:hypothetical protein
MNSLPTIATGIAPMRNRIDADQTTDRQALPRFGSFAAARTCIVKVNIGVMSAPSHQQPPIALATALHTS